MSDKTDGKDTRSPEKEENRTLSDEETGKVSGGLSQEDLERWAVRGPVDRSRFGPGAGE